MFCCPRRKQEKNKKHTDTMKVCDKESFRPHKRVTPVVTSETTLPKPRKASWWQRWRGRKRIVDIQTTKDVGEAVLLEEKTKPWWGHFFNSKRQLQTKVSALETEEETEKTTEEEVEETIVIETEKTTEEDVEETIVLEIGNITEEEVEETIVIELEKTPEEETEETIVIEIGKITEEEDENTADRAPKNEAKEASSKTAELIKRQQTPTGHGGSLQEEVISLTKIYSSSPALRTLSSEELISFGLPNLSQTCYMNSTLQALQTLPQFVQEVYNQEEVWRSHPKTEIFRRFVDVGTCRFSNSMPQKKKVLTAFKQAVSEYNLEFEDNSQKDAHEFLSSLLELLMALNLRLQTAAVCLGIGYTCPVNAHIAFKMLSTRACTGCGSQSVMDEEFISLSLDLLPGGSVNQSLQDYMKENELEFKCDCGAEQSTLQSSFLTLPNVLILQLKRFRFTESLNLMKASSPVVLSRELQVDLEPFGNVKTSVCYSLVSIISHLGSTATSGHYICDGAYRESFEGLTDRWLTYNDAMVRETTGTTVCQQRQRSAYLLFYEKQN